MARGRPSRYKPEHAEQAYKLCLLGATDAELADFFGVQLSTLKNWKSAHPEFLAALKDGKETADATVADRLYRRALGYSHPDVHISNYQGEITVTPITKHYPPDTTAAIFWLKNRHPDKWRDRREVENTNKNYEILAEPMSADEWEDIYNLEAASRPPESTH